MHTSALIVEAMIAISSDPLNYKPLHIMNNLGNLLVFFKQSSLCFIWTAPDESSSIIALANADSWFNH